MATAARAFGASVEAQWSKTGLAFQVDGEPHLFLADGSRLYSVDRNSLADYRELAAAFPSMGCTASPM
jgi:hypothetical protein